MLSVLPGRRIWLCTGPTDMRRSFDGLSAQVRNHLGEDPSSGHWFVFINRRCTQIKVLAFEDGGYCLWSKRLEQCGIQLSRSSLSTWAGRAIDLLEPIVDAQYRHVLQSRVLAMDETPIKAGGKSKGKMRQGYFWPMYGDADEIVFRYAPTRKHRHVQALLGDFQGTLLSDGYDAYAAYARNNDQVTPAQCWGHCRRDFERAQESEPGASGDALAIIGALYRHEQIIRDKKLRGEKKRVYRMQHSEPIVRAFWRWCEEQCQRGNLLPSSPLGLGH